MSAAVKFPDVEVQMSGEDGNAFAIIGRVSQALKRAGHVEGAKEFRAAAFGADSYDAILQLVLRTVETR